MVKVTIIGAGITGVTAAYALARAGHEVTVIDRHRYPAMETSFANGGQLSASNAEVWNSWATVAKGLRWMMQSSAPLLVNPKPSWHKLSWMAEFCGAIRKHDANTIETTRLAIQARTHLFRIAEEEGIDFDLERRGILHIYHDEPSFRAAAKTNELLRQGGLDRFPVTGDEARSIEPALDITPHAGFYTPSDCTGDIHKFTRGLAKACEKRGVRFLHDYDVAGIEPKDDVVKIALSGRSAEELTCEKLIICAGVASRQLATSLGDRINIYPVKGYSITVVLKDGKSQQAAPQVSLLDESAKIVTSRLGIDRFRVAGTAEFNGYNRDIRDDRIGPLVSWSRKLFPSMATDTIIPWAGLRPMTPSMMPKVGPGRHPRILYNCGHGHLGWTLSAITAEMIAQYVT